MTTPAREGVARRVRRFAVLRGAQRALDPSFRAPLLADLEALRSIRERLRDLVRRCDDPAQTPGAGGASAVEEELLDLDGALDGYAGVLLAKLDQLPMAQLRASLSLETPAQRGEVMALLELCMESESALAGHLAVVDFLITLLCVDQRDGSWIVVTDPPDLNDTVRRRCGSAPDLGPGVESKIVSRFRDAVERLARDADGEAILREMAIYKTEIAGFFFEPAVLRCVVGYNAAARNHFEARRRRGRELDTAIDDEIGLAQPLADYDEAIASQSLPPPHEVPGVLAVQEIIQHKLLGADPVEGPASRVAARLDLSWLTPSERRALIQSRDPSLRAVRMTVVLGHLAVVLPECQRDLAALNIDEAKLDAWICALGDELQLQINDLLRDDLQGALDLGDTKSRFLTAVLLVARRRQGRRGQQSLGEPDSFAKNAVQLVRECLERMQLERQPRMFFDLFGGGWRRSAALAAAGLLIAWVGVVQLLPPGGERATHDLSQEQLRSFSWYLRSAYRDYASDGSMLVGVATDEWEKLRPIEREAAAMRLQERLKEKGIAEFLLYDDDHVLQAHYKGGRWRSTRAWSR